jgi:hypothetical protein
MKMSSEGFYLDTISKGSGAPLLAWYNQSQGFNSQARLLSEMLYAEPMLRIVCNNHCTLYVDRYFIRHVDKYRPLLVVSSRNPLYRGFVILGQLLRKRYRKKQRDAFPSWNRRRCLSNYGTSQGLSYSQTVSATIGGFTSPSGFDATTIDFTRFRDGPNGVYRLHMSFDDVVRFARKMVPFVGSVFRRTLSLGRYGEHTLSSITITRTAVTMELKGITYQSYPGSKFMQCKGITVRFLRGTSNEALKISISGLGGVVFDGTPSIGSMSTYQSSVTSLTGINTPTGAYRRVHDQLMDRVRGNLGFDMAQFRPAFYHTQGMALNDVILDISSNFENFVESPELFVLLEELIWFDPATPFGKFSSLPYIGRVLWLAKLLSGGILLWNFALRPTYEAVLNLAKETVKPSRAEAEMSFKGSDINLLPSGLAIHVRNVVKTYGRLDSDLAYYDFKFRSMVTSTLGYVELAHAFLEQHPLLKAHVLPSPDQVWASAGGSFIVDWAVPISGYLQAHQAYAMSATIPFRIGHTARLVFDFKQGDLLEGFWRSAESNFLTDPPGDTWLMPSGVPWISIPLGLSVLIGAVQSNI